MPNEMNEAQATAVPEAVEELSPTEMFLRDMNAADTETPMEEVGNAPEVQAAEEAMGMPAAEQPPVEAMPQQDQMQDYRNTIATLLDIVKSNQAEKAAAREEQEAAETAQEEMAEEPIEEEEPFDEEAFNERFYANPSATIREMAEKIANKNVMERLSGLQDELRPLLEESKAAQHRESVKQALSEFLDSTPDADDYFDDIARYVNDNNLSADDPRSYLDAYRESKLKSQAGIIDQLRQANADGSRSLADYLADDNSVAQIIADDNIKSKVIENYLKELQEGGRPATITSGGSAQIPGNPAKAPASMDEARNFLLGDLRR